MPGLSLHTDAFILRKRPPAESFRTLSAFSPADGLLTVLERVSRKTATAAPPVDLFDEASLILESSNQGQTWFLREARLITRHESIGRDYETLAAASRFSGIVARNLAPAEGRPSLGVLLRSAFQAFGTASRPDIVGFKSLYRFARDEGHPVAQQWISELPARERTPAESLLNRPVAELDVDAATVARITGSLERYLAGHTEMIVE